MNQWRIGDVTVTRVVEMEVTGGSRFLLPEATPEAVQPISWLQPHFANAQGKLIMSIHALIIDTGERRIIVDTCIGNDKERSIPNWSQMQGPFLEDLAQAGYTRDNIDTVLCTHLHVDHVGWNTMLVDGQWVPTFGNARYLIARDEWAHWDTHGDENYGPVLEDSVRPIFDAGLVDLVNADHRLCDEVWLEPTPGHTPGHVSVRISSKGEDALITGDFVHHPCQMARLDWVSTADFDQNAAREMRKTVFNKYADQPVLIIGTHFATPSAGKLRRDGDAFRLDVS
ncbi:MAG: MBL fold metallo-hydrolase [Gammaproteobacteria bacterium]|nr:MBL fold metallo-hydrolase [Gammaproteobacteria bacterium]